ncbi:MAG: hypothetical protein AAF183_13020 [Pseudomonadota bacterium]
MNHRLCPRGRSGGNRSGHAAQCSRADQRPGGQRGHLQRVGEALEFLGIAGQDGGEISEETRDTHKQRSEIGQGHCRVRAHRRIDQRQRVLCINRLTNEFSVNRAPKLTPALALVFNGTAATSQQRQQLTPGPAKDLLCQAGLTRLIPENCDAVRDLCQQLLD